MKTNNQTKADYVDYLNEIDIPAQDLKSEGGLIPDHAKLGNWMRLHDPIAFNVGYNEWCRENS